MARMTREEFARIAQTEGLQAALAKRAAQYTPEQQTARMQRRASRQMVMGPGFDLRQATPDQLLKLESLDTGKGSSGVLPGQDQRRRTALARYAIRTGAKPAPKDLIDGKTGEVRAGVDPILAAFLKKRTKKPYKNTGRPYSA